MNKTIKTLFFTSLLIITMESVVAGKVFSKNSVQFKNIIKQLRLNIKKVKKDLLVFKIKPNNPSETIVVIPEIVKESEHFLELNSYILVVDSKTGKIKNKYFESAKTNGWISDAVVLNEISIDTARYNITNEIRAFGIKVSFTGDSRPNPYENKTLSLFIEDGKQLKKILKQTSYEYSGEWNVSCEGEFNLTKNIFSIMKDKTNNYFNILLQSKYTNTKNTVDKLGNCDYKDKQTTGEKILKFNGKEYK